MLNNGTTLLIDRDPRFNSVSYSVCILGGSRDESASSIGTTHVLEHMLFKRTKHKTSHAIACIIDELGGDVNAFTDAMSLCIHGTVPARQFSKLRDFINELLFCANFNPKDLKTEKEVIRQEILESGDNPAEAVYEHFTKLLWPNSSLGLPIFGTLETLSEVTISSLFERLSQLLCGSRIVIGVVGCVDLDATIRYVEDTFGALPRSSRPLNEAPLSSNGIGYVSRPVSQSYLALGYPWPSVVHEDYLIATVIASIMGQGMSSRLFQLIREKHGLTYDINAHIDAYHDISVFCISATLERKNLDQALSLIAREIQDLASTIISNAEFERAISFHKSQLEMERDDIESRLWRAIDSEVFFGRHVSTLDVIDRLGALKISDATRFMNKWSTLSNCLLVLGGDIDGYSVQPEIQNLCGASA